MSKEKSVFVAVAVRRVTRDRLKKLKESTGLPYNFIVEKALDLFEKEQK